MGGLSKSGRMAVSIVNGTSQLHTNVHSSGHSVSKRTAPVGVGRPHTVTGWKKFGGIYWAA